MPDADGFPGAVRSSADNDRFEGQRKVFTDDSRIELDLPFLFNGISVDFVRLICSAEPSVVSLEQNHV